MESGTQGDMSYRPAKNRTVPGIKNSSMEERNESNQADKFVRYCNKAINHTKKTMDKCLRYAEITLGKNNDKILKASKKNERVFKILSEAIETATANQVITEAIAEEQPFTLGGKEYVVLPIAKYKAYEECKIRSDKVLDKLKEAQVCCSDMQKLRDDIMDLADQVYNKEQEVKKLNFEAEELNRTLEQEKGKFKRLVEILWAKVDDKFKDTRQGEKSLDDKIKIIEKQMKRPKERGRSGTPSTSLERKAPPEQGSVGCNFVVGIKQSAPPAPLQQPAIGGTTGGMSCYNNADGTAVTLQGGQQSMNEKDVQLNPSTANAVPYGFFRDPDIPDDSGEAVPAPSNITDLKKNIKNYGINHWLQFLVYVGDYKKYPLLFLSRDNIDKDLAGGFCLKYFGKGYDYEYLCNIYESYYIVIIGAVPKSFRSFVEALQKLQKVDAKIYYKKLKYNYLLGNYEESDWLDFSQLGIH